MTYGINQRHHGKHGMTKEHSLNKKFWNKKKVFITGHTGFKGSWLSFYLLKLNVSICGYSLKLRQNRNRSCRHRFFHQQNYEDQQFAFRVGYQILIQYLRCSPFLKFTSFV